MRHALCALLVRRGYAQGKRDRPPNHQGSKPGGSADRAADKVRIGHQCEDRARQIGLTMPVNVLARADRVIK